MIDKIREFEVDGRKLMHIFKDIDVSEKEGKVYVTLGYEEAGQFKERAVKQELMKYLKMDLGYAGAKITFKDIAQEEIMKNSLLNQDGVFYLLVSSGKGGVGKSNVSANLANLFNDKGYKVALIDCDIYGSSIPGIFGIQKYPTLEDNNILHPAIVDGINIVSVDFLMQAQLPIMWRGPMLGRALNHFFYYTKYEDDIEIVILDLPPGTGDVALDIQQLVPHAKQVVVTTPHPTAANIAIKAGRMAEKMNHEVVGVIENMSYFVYEDKKLDIFGVGGGDMVANTLNVPLLGKLEILPPKGEGLYSKDERNYQIYEDIVTKIIDKELI
ncbi:MAG: P-loop NTPase [Erysipelotrichales bacterium]